MSEIIDFIQRNSKEGFTSIIILSLNSMGYKIAYVIFSKNLEVLDILAFAHGKLIQMFGGWY